MSREKTRPSGGESGTARSRRPQGPRSRRLAGRAAELGAIALLALAAGWGMRRLFAVDGLALHSAPHNAAYNAARNGTHGAADGLGFLDFAVHDVAVREASRYGVPVGDLALGSLTVGLPVAAVLPVVLVALFARPARPASVAVSVPAWVIGFLAWAAYTVAEPTGREDGGEEVGRLEDLLARLEVIRAGVVDGWARLLDLPVPAPADPDLLVVPLALTWLAAALGAELTVRTRARLLPVLPAAVALLLATAMAVRAPGSNVLPAVVLVAVAALFLMLRVARHPLGWPAAAAAPPGGAGTARPGEGADHLGGQAGDQAVEQVGEPARGMAANRGAEAGRLDGGPAHPESSLARPGCLPAGLPVGVGRAAAPGARPSGLGVEPSGQVDAPAEAVPEEAAALADPSAEVPVERPTDGRATVGGPVRDRRARLRPAMVRLVSVAAVVVAGVSAASHLPALGLGEPVDPRVYRSTPPQPRADLHPLSALAGWNARPDEELFRVEAADAGGQPLVLRLAVLDTHDGASWQSTAGYVRVGPVVAPADGEADSASATPVTQQVEIVGLRGFLLPALPGVRRIGPVHGGEGAGHTGAQTSAETPAATAGSTEGTEDTAETDIAETGATEAVSDPVEAAVDPATGTLLSPRPLTPGTRYEGVSVPPVHPAAADLAGLTTETFRAGTDSQVDTGPTDSSTGSDPSRSGHAYFAVPESAPPALRQVAALAGGDGQSPFQRAAMLRQYLSANFVFDPAVPPGHSLAHIEHFLAHTRRGTSEQFATTYVLAARLLDLPARLVVGFVAQPAEPGQPQAVRGSDALAWAEVHFDGVGWLPFFPTPRAADAQGAELAGSNQGESPEHVRLIEAALRLPAEEGASPAPDKDTPRPGGSSTGSRPWAGPAAVAAAGIGMLLAGYLALAGMLPRMRRRRLGRAARDRDRVVGAWRCAVDALVRTGCPVPSAASPTEVAELAAASVGPPGDAAMRGLAELATLALFAPPGAAGWDEQVGGHTADEAWRLLEQFERAARDGVPWSRRVRRRIAPAAVLAEITRLRAAR